VSDVIQTGHAIVLFSGGQDSTVCLAWALQRFERVETIGFNYGQRHSVEMACRDTLRAAVHAEFPQWSARLGCDHVLDLAVLGSISDTALTHQTAISFNVTGLPNTFVPGRNLMFFQFAAAVAYRRGIKHLIGGMCETDYSGYPDCRDDTLKALQVALSLGMDQRFVIHTPLMWLDKAATWRLGYEIGGAAFERLVVEKTHTCYLGDRARRYAWGYGCGACPACALRANGFAAYQAGDQARASNPSSNVNPERVAPCPAAR
jgi:7-cyano-7-deazaguanine synthase